MGAAPGTLRRAALDLLARREHSQQELRHKLRRRFDAQALDAVLQALAAEGLQSDLRYCGSYARERALRGYGPLRIRAELLQRGVSAEAADAGLAAVCDEERLDWAVLARRALERKFGSAEVPAAFSERARRLRFLHYRGYEPDCLEVVAVDGTSGLP